MSSTSTTAALREHSAGVMTTLAVNHPLTTMGLFVLLVVLVVYLYYKWQQAKKATAATAKSGMAVGVTPFNNLQSGSNNPLWQLGSGDAGLWGAVGRATTETQAAVYTPELRAGRLRPMPASGRCGPGERAEVVDGAPVCRLVAAGGSHPSCGIWGEGAIAEEQALSALETFGANKEPMAHALPDSKLEEVMHNGGMA